MEVPTFILNLNLPPKDRWTHIIEKYVHLIKDAERQIDEFTKQSLYGWMKGCIEGMVKLMSLWAKQNKMIYGLEELKAISKQCNIPFEKLLMLQLTYEASTCCTSILYQNENNDYVTHFRTMDWSLDFLRPLTINIEYQRNGKLVAKTTTWAGYVGVLTGSSNLFSVSINYRFANGGYFKNIVNCLSLKWPIGYLVREIFETAQDYKHAHNLFTRCELIVPCYIILSGPHQYEGSVITRDQKSSLLPLYLSPSTPLLIQTNKDHFGDKNEANILLSCEREKLINEKYEQFNIPLTIENWWEIFSLYPIKNALTIYTTCMISGTNFYSTILNKPINNICQVHKVKDTLISNSAPIRKNTLSIIRNNHKGVWHSKISDCGIKCALYLIGKGKIGQKHWSCCFEFDFYVPHCSLE